VQSFGWSTGVACSARVCIRIFLTVASFIIYASAVLALHQDRNNQFLAERGAFAAAVSSAVYHAPPGTAYSSVSARVRDLNTPLETALKQATEVDLEPGSLMQDGGMDGNGIGYLVLATAAVLIFGVHTSSPILMMLVLMGISGAAFLRRFGAGNAVVVVLYFFALTLMLFTPLVWHPDTAVGIPIGGIRYLAVLGILPAFHLAGELADPAAPGPAIGRSRFCLLGVQVVILALAVLTRTSGASLLGAIGVVWAFGLWRNRRDRFCVRRQLRNGAFTAGVGVGFFGVLLLFLPTNYFSEGRVTGVVWHRAFISLGLNPAWPFGNMREIYDCNHAPFPPGSELQPGVLDKNGDCVWLNYTRRHHLPAEVVNLRLYERVMRDAFFNVVRLYPRQVLETYIYYKPPLVFTSIKQSIDLNLNLGAYRPFKKGLLVVAFGVLLIFFVTGLVVPDPTQSLWLGGITLEFALFSIPAYFFAWAGAAQTPDLRPYAIVGVGVALSAFIEWSRRIPLTRMPPARHS
jgi:hypothetical protein